MSISLYTLTAELAEIRELVESGELTPEAQEQADALMSQVLDELIPQKVESYCGLIRALKLEAEAYAAEEKRLADHRGTRERLAAHMSNRLQAGLEAAGLQKLQAGLFAVAIQASPPALSIGIGAEIPAEYLTPQEPKVDKRRLLADVKAGASFPGVSITQGKHLRIR